MPPVRTERIEDFLETDFAAATALDHAAFATSEGSAHERERSLREEWTRSWSRLRAARDPSGALVGFALSWHIEDEVQLLNIVVSPNARRKGIGRALMDDLLAHARSTAAARVLLEVRASNAPAIALYEGLGFKSFNVRKAYYADGEAAVEYSLTI